MTIVEPGTQVRAIDGVVSTMAGTVAGATPNVAVQEAGAWRCEVVCTAQELEALADEWRALERQAGQGAQTFQSSAWVLAWEDAFRGLNGAKYEPHVIVVRDGAGRAVLIWPLMRVRYPLNLTLITWLSDPFGQYGDVITSLSGAALHGAMKAALDMLKADDGADLLRLKFVRADAVAASFLRQHALQTAEEYGAPWLDLSPYATPDDLEKRYNRTQRRRRRKIINRLKKHLGVEPSFRRLTDAGEIRTAISAMLENKRQWLREKGLVSRALFHERAEPFFQRLAERMMADAQGPDFVLSVLEANGEQLSWEMGFRWKGRHLAYMTAQRSDVRAFSIGRLHMHHSQSLAVADGMQVFDLLVPAAPHKESWSSHVEEVRNYFLPLSLRGRLLGQTYLCHLRPLLREAYHRLPAGVRSFLHLSEIHEHDKAEACPQGAH